MKKAAFILLILTTWTASCFSEPLKLNGIAEFNRLRTTFYIAALYLENTNNNAQSILKSQQPARMEMRIVTTKWRSRSFSSYILGQVAINNANTDISKFTAEDGALSRLVKAAKDEPIVAGDSIIVEFDGSRSILLLNSKPIAVESGKNLFNAMLNLWLGKRPPSRQFKEDILTLAEPGLIQETLDLFLLLSPSLNRQTYAATKSLNVAAYSPLTTIHTEQKQQIAKSNRASNASIAAAEKASKQANENAKQAEAAQLKAKQQAKQQAVALAAAEKAAKAEQDKAKALAAQEAVIIQKQAAQAAQAEADRLFALEQEAEKQRLEKEAMLIQQRQASEQAKILAQKKAQYDYTAHLRSQVYKYVEYPARAYKLGQEGTSVLSITVEASGKISQATIHTSSSHKALDKAAVKAAKKAKAKAFTSDMAVEQLVFLMRVSFRI